MIAYDSLREYIHMIDALGQAKTIRGADWRLELACINELVAEQKGPLLIFDEIASYPRGYRVVTNLLTTHERLCLALGIPAEIPPPESVGRWKNRLREVEPLAPIVVDDAANRRNGTPLTVTSTCSLFRRRIDFRETAADTSARERW